MIVSPSDSNTTGGPAVKIDACSVITVKSDIGATSAPCPADAPSTAVTSGTRPEHRAWASMSVGVRTGACPSARKPAPSSIMISGTRSVTASSATRYRFEFAALADRAGLHGEVLGGDHHRPAVDASRAHDDRVGRQVLTADERAELLERTRVEQVVDARPDVELAGGAVLRPAAPRRPWRGRRHAARARSSRVALQSASSVVSPIRSPLVPSCSVADPLGGLRQWSPAAPGGYRFGRSM